MENETKKEKQRVNKITSREVPIHPSKIKWSITKLSKTHRPSEAIMDTDKNQPCNGQPAVG